MNMNLFDCYKEQEIEFEIHKKYLKEKNTKRIGCNKEDANYFASCENSKYPIFINSKTYKEVLLLIKSQTNHTNENWIWEIQKRNEDDSRNTKCVFNLSNFGWHNFKTIRAWEVEFLFEEKKI